MTCPSASATTTITSPRSSRLRSPFGRPWPGDCPRRSTVRASSSATAKPGETRKFDGLYEVVRLLLRQPPLAVVSLVGDATTTELNVVSRDYVIDAIDVIRRIPDAIGETYQLTNPDPPTIDTGLDQLGDAADRRLIRIRVPRRGLKAVLSRLPGLSDLVGIQPELVDHFDLPTLMTPRRLGGP